MIGFGNFEQPCNCYECTGPVYKASDNGTERLWNNMKYHTFLERCEDCGHRKTEYLDLGRKGYYVCWWCEYREAEPGELL